MMDSNSVERIAHPPQPDNPKNSQMDYELHRSGPASDPSRRWLGLDAAPSSNSFFFTTGLICRSCKIAQSAW